jgi:regulator of protease activity HflC (stomatin/prohibitin superfamily)
VEEAEMATYSAPAPNPEANSPELRSPGTPVPPSPGQQPARRLTERPAHPVSGLPVLVLSIVAELVAVGLLILAKPAGGAWTVTLIIIGALLLLAGILAQRGLFQVIPGEARVVQLFGRYSGTVREPGLRWVNPFTERRRVSTRIRNHETALAKVNDADGNPIEIAAVVVWQVNDTALALYAVDEFIQFVATQTETAVRHIATSYPYDTSDASQLSLRGNADEITERLSAEIAARVASAGVTIIESRLTRLSYAAEIAQAMLRRQAASAVVAARSRIVQGAVGMVRLALQQLEEQDVVELDEERKAAMVSNLLVVLCSEQATQQVVNTGSLYQ